MATQNADDVRPEKVVSDDPVECYHKGYEDGYEAGKEAADSGFYALGYQAAFRSVRDRIAECFDRWGNQPIPAHNDGSREGV